MIRRGRPRAWSEEEREEVVRLAAEGKSRREIAASVFGDGRYRGRVERILTLQATQRPPTDIVLRAEVAEHDASVPSAPSIEAAGIAEFVARYERWLATSSAVPPLSESERLLRIKRQLHALETVEYLSRLTRPLV